MTEVARITNPVRQNIEICEALGINPSKVNAVTIELTGHNLPVVIIKETLSTDMNRKIASVIRRYRLVQEEPEV